MMISSSVNNATAAAAYARTQSGALSPDEIDNASSSGGASFQDAVQGALESAIGDGKEAETKAASGLNGHGNLTDVVTSISQAQMVMETASVVRDRVIQSYQEVMRMTI